MQTLSSDSKVWIYQSDRIFSQEEETQIGNILHNFINHWHAHHQKLKASFEIRHYLFIVLMVDESDAKASGCSIDSSVKVIKDIESAFGLNFFNRTMIAYKESDQIQLCSMESFQQKIDKKEIDSNTLVYNNLVNSLKALEHEWEVPLEKSWHKRVFQIN